MDERTAYWFDDGGRQLIRFDPTDVVISGAVPIDGTERDGSADVAPAWQWYSLDIESDDLAVASARSSHASHGAFGWYTDSRAFSSTVNEDYTLSTLLELTPDGFEERATVEGLLDGIVRVR